MIHSLILSFLSYCAYLLRTYILQRELWLLAWKGQTVNESGRVIMVFLKVFVNEMRETEKTASPKLGADWILHIDKTRALYVRRQWKR